MSRQAGANAEVARWIVQAVKRYCLCGMQGEQEEGWVRHDAGSVRRNASAVNSDRLLRGYLVSLRGLRSMVILPLPLVLAADLADMSLPSGRLDMEGLSDAAVAEPPTHEPGDPHVPRGLLVPALQKESWAFTEHGDGSPLRRPTCRRRVRSSGVGRVAHHHRPFWSCSSRSVISARSSGDRRFVGSVARSCKSLACPRAFSASEARPIFAYA